MGLLDGRRIGDGYDTSAPTFVLPGAILQKALSGRYARNDSSDEMRILYNQSQVLKYRVVKIPRTIRADRSQGASSSGAPGAQAAHHQNSTRSADCIVLRSGTG